jgi:hypothetical protein
MAYEQIKTFTITTVYYYELIIHKEDLTNDDHWEHWYSWEHAFVIDFVSSEYNSFKSRYHKKLNGPSIKEDLLSLLEVVRQVRDKLSQPVSTPHFTDELYKCLTDAVKGIEALIHDVDGLIASVASITKALRSIDIFTTPDMRNEVEKLKALA